MSEYGKNTTVSGLVSVIIPAYNAALLIEETLHSVLNQSYAQIQIIVVDDGSTDKTAEVVQKFAPRVRLAQQANSGGCSSPRNHGLRLAQGEFVTFFDADDLMISTKIERQVAFLRQRAQCDAVLMDYRNFDEQGEAATAHFDTCRQLRAECRRNVSNELLLDAATATRILITENYAIAGSPLIRRCVFAHVEAFDENLRASEDFDFVYRLARHSGMGVICDTGFLRRFHESNMSKRIAHVLQYKIESRTKLLRGESDIANRRLLSSEIANYHLSLAEFAHRSMPARSLRHIWSALRFGHAPNLRVARGLMKCALSVVRPA